MKKLTIPSLVAFAASFISLAVAQTTADRETGWLEDWEQVQADAEASELPVFLLFTGSDWCPPCKALEENILSSSEFEEFAEESLVLMKADFPRRGNQSDELKEQNKALNEQYGIRGFPTVIVLVDGEEVHRAVGFGGGEPEDYISTIESKISN